ncbi:unnamed protein product [Heligmosomoides polygyrus]|uniref:TIL domain-containing protein n=1 Tax=Heligmosomoides polygyrus TaxID=6339 RepID=A0A183GE93_HELPZ|nr:unnamed protein product [Heligmosomoides polygyrus]
MAAVQSIAKKPDIRRRQPSVTTAAVLVFFASLIVLFAAFVIGTSATSYIPPGEDGETCADTLCEDGMVCVQGQTGANCMAKDPASNCELLDCASGRKCIYEEEECIPDKACFARPVCSTGGPQPSPIEQAAEMIGSNGGQSLPSEAPPGGPVGGSSVARPCGANEKVRACGALCEGKCENVGKGPIACLFICLPPACSCKDGFYRDGSGLCVTATLCQRDSPGGGQPPCLAKCSTNQHCVLSSDDSSCYNPPCPPVPTCVQNQPLRGPR